VVPKRPYQDAAVPDAETEAKLKERGEEEDCDRWFNQARPMIKVRKTWRENWLANEENDMCSNDSQSDSEEMEGDSGRVHHGPDDTTRKEVLEVNMVLVIPAEFWVPDSKVAELTVRVECAIFEKPARPGEHMRSLYI
jgi:hypothetical protein